MPDAPATHVEPRHAFVYGTLRQGCINDITRLQPPPRFVGHARVPGLLFHLGEYPGATLGGEQWVLGEVYQVLPELELVLDEIEGLGANPTDEYVKRNIRVQVGDAMLDCFVYEINPQRITAALRLDHGDWTRR